MNAPQALRRAALGRRELHMHWIACCANGPDRIGLMLELLIEWSKRGNLGADAKDYGYCIDAPDTMPAGSMVWWRDPEFDDVQVSVATTVEREALKP